MKIEMELVQGFGLLIGYEKYERKIVIVIACLGIAITRN